MIKVFLKSNNLLVLCFIFSTTLIMAKSSEISFQNKIIPDQIFDEANAALSHYPSLENTPIEFKIKSSLHKSFMKAQPKFGTLLNPIENRAYKILISSTFSLENKTLALKDIPKDVLIGWLGHELGHIMDYKERSALNLCWFGIKYYFSGNHIRKAERIADSYAVSHNMKDYIIATKNYILNHADLSDKYKERIKRLYVSPDEILKIVEEQEASKAITN